VQNALDVMRGGAKHGEIMPASGRQKKEKRASAEVVKPQERFSKGSAGQNRGTDILSREHRGWKTGKRVKADKGKTERMGSQRRARLEEGDQTR